jgi:hypothetical protein
MAQALRAGANLHPYCSVPGCTSADLTVDHIDSRTRGKPGLTLADVQVLCRFHNSQKGAKSYRAEDSSTVEETAAWILQRHGGVVRSGDKRRPPTSLPRKKPLRERTGAIGEKAALFSLWRGGVAARRQAGVELGYYILEGAITTA